MPNQDAQPNPHIEEVKTILDRVLHDRRDVSRPVVTTSHTDVGDVIGSIGWCYFSSADKFSVEVVWGFIDSGFAAANKVAAGDELELFTSIYSVGAAIAVGQTTVAGGSVVAGPGAPGIGNVPLWLSAGAGWIDALVLVNPTAASGQVTVNVFNCATCHTMPAPTAVPVPLPARGMGIVFLSNFSAPTLSGNATIDSGATCCFAGWHWAFNVTTHRVIFREVALDRDSARFLAPADRP